MINKFENIQKNLLIKRANNSDVLAYNKEYISKPIDVNFDILDAFSGTEKQYAKLELAIKNNTCREDGCKYEMGKIAQLKQAPQLFIDFMADVSGELSTTDATNFDPNSDADYTIANCIMTQKPGYSKTHGYDIVLNLLEDGTQEITFTGPGFYEPLVLNNSTLRSILDNDTYIVAPTPEIPMEMELLMMEIGLFEPNMIDSENNKLLGDAKISEQFILTNPDGTPDYEIVDIGNGKGRNILKYDFDKIERTADPFINAEVAGLLDSEQEAIAAWNVYLAQGNKDSEDVKINQSVKDWVYSWSYETDLPLTQDKKALFLKKYKEYFASNYLMDYVSNQLPYIQEDTAIIDLAELKQEKAQQFIDSNNLN